MKIHQAIAGEFLGTMGLLIVVVGSGIMGENLSQGNQGLALLANSLATGAGLYALIQTFRGISGAHFNPVVTLKECLGKSSRWKHFLPYMFAQILGGISGVIVTHAMFAQDLFQISKKNRGDLRFAFSEFVATFGLIVVVSLSEKKDSKTTPLVVSSYITAAYWCTSSTSFANPAVTIARSFTNTFSGIDWSGTPSFLVAQFFGGFVAFWVSRKLST